MSELKGMQSRLPTLTSVLTCHFSMHQVGRLQALCKTRCVYRKQPQCRALH